jgi:hypothetical protein
VSHPQGGHFEKPEESSQHMKLLYIRDHLEGKLVSRMLIDGDIAVNLMLHSVFMKLGREGNKLVKTNLTINGVGGGGQPDGGPGCHLHGAHHREHVSCYHVLRHRGARSLECYS